MKHYVGGILDSYAEPGMTPLEATELVVWVSGVYSDRSVEAVFRVLKNFDWKEKHDEYWLEYRKRENSGDYSSEGSPGEFLRLLEDEGLIETLIHRVVGGNSY